MRSAGLDTRVHMNGYLKFDELNWWTKGSRPKVMWLTGDPGMRKSTIFGYLVHEFKTPWDVVCQFL